MAGQETKKARQSYTQYDETLMWMYLYEKLKIMDPAADEPKGLRIWKQYIEEKKVKRSVDSLTTRFRRHMINNLHRADLECRVMMFLYSRLKLKMDENIKTALELKFSVEIIFDKYGFVKSFQRANKMSSSKGVPEQRQERDLGASSSKAAIENSPAESIVEVSDNSPRMRRTSLNFTQEVKESMMESRYLTRYGSEKRREDNPSAEDCSSTPSIEESFEESEVLENASCAHEDVPAQVECEVLSPESAEPVRNEPPATPTNDDGEEDNSTVHPLPIAVSLSSDTCQQAWDRLYSAMDDEASDANWRSKEEALALTKEWEDRMSNSNIFSEYEIPSSYAERAKASVDRVQKILWRSCSSLAKYELELKRIEDIVGKELEGHKRQRKQSTERTIERASNGEIFLPLSRSDSSQVPPLLRKRKLMDILSAIWPHLVALTSQEIIGRLEKMEDSATLLPDEYDNIMDGIKDALTKNMGILQQ
ncbi:hypothetical protein Q1695_010752 [Nippostrongylus brasiliensis]|nr:hypothetical protein Q1695_010752 [Nippostrongylus brasiliensis]